MVLRRGEVAFIVRLSIEGMAAHNRGTLEAAMAVRREQRWQTSHREILEKTKDTREKRGQF